MKASRQTVATAFALGLAVALSVAPVRTLEGQARPRIGLVRDLVIDGSEQVFTSIGAVAVDRSGGLAVSQPSDGAIRFFDKAGRPTGKVGRKGKGPGEFVGIELLGWRGDTLTVHDIMQQRFTLLTADRTVIRTEPSPPRAVPPKGSGDLPSFDHVAPYARYADGSMLSSINGVTGSTNPPERYRNSTSYALLDRHGNIMRMLALVPLPDASAEAYDASGKPLGTAYLPFIPNPVQGSASDGSRLVFAAAIIEGAAAGTFHVMSFNARGDTVLSKRFAFTPVRIPKNVGDSVLDATYTKLRRSGNLEMAAAFRREARVPPMYPPLDDLNVGSDGSIWIGMTPAARGKSYDRISATGVMLGEVVLPRSARIVASNATHIWTVEQDEYDVESIMRYRIIN